jgi:hypothetical protein
MLGTIFFSSTLRLYYYYIQEQQQQQELFFFDVKKKVQLSLESSFFPSQSNDWLLVLSTA